MAMTTSVERRDLLGATALVTAAAGMGLGAAQAFAQESSQAFAPGTYEASATGKNGELTVEVTFSEGRIERVDVTGHGETPGISDLAVASIPQRIVDTQSLGVDVVSGATLTSRAILNATLDCAAQAGADEDAVCAVPPVPGPFERELEADVVVIGTGGAGLVAAYQALSAGKSVVVLEKQAETGGSTRLNGGMFIAPANDDELSSTSALSEDELAQLYITYAGDAEHFDADMVRDFVASMEDGLELLRRCAYEPYRYLYPGWLPLDPTDEDADPIHVIIMEPYLPVTPSSETTWSEEDDGGWPDGIGCRFTVPMTAKVREMGGRILTRVSATSLATRDGAVCGVEAVGDDGASYRVSAPSVILASGGFGGNAELRQRWWGSADSLYGGTYANDGACIQMAEDAGAAVDFVETPCAEGETLYCSVGGVLIDHEARVLDGDGAPVPGLYAAGEIADLRILGQTYPICGTFDQWSIYTGKLAGASAAVRA